VVDIMSIRISKVRVT